MHSCIKQSNESMPKSNLKWALLTLSFGHAHLMMAALNLFLVVAVNFLLLVHRIDGGSTHTNNWAVLV